MVLIYFNTAEWTEASWREPKCPSFETAAKGDSNPGSLDCESGVLPLSYHLVHTIHRRDMTWQVTFRFSITQNRIDQIFEATSTFVSDLINQNQLMWHKLLALWICVKINGILEAGRVSWLSEAGIIVFIDVLDDNDTLQYHNKVEWAVRTKVETRASDFIDNFPVWCIQCNYFSEIMFIIVRCYYSIARIKIDRWSVSAIGLYRENAIAIQKESGDSNVKCSTSQCELRSTFPNLRVTNVIRIVTYYTLPP